MGHLIYLKQEEQVVSGIQARNKHKIPLRDSAVSTKDYTLQLLDNKYYLTNETKDPLSLYYYYKKEVFLTN